MAKPVAPDGTIALLEEAFDLLRRAPLSTLLCHGLGSTPIALGLLLFRSDMSNPRTPDAICALEALVLAMLLVWMNCWRAVFAGRLRRILSGALDSPWTWRRIWNLISGQAFLGASKILVWPVALLIVFPFAWVVAFYRSATAIAARDDLDPQDVISQAKSLAGISMRQSWLMLPVLTLFWLILFVNLGLALAMLPQVIRVVTGYESQFSRSGLFFVFNPLFFSAVLALSWILFDPFLQAVYCVRAFHGESLRTGEDLRAGLRALRAAAGVLLLLALSLGTASAITPNQLERSVQQAIQSHDYDWRLPPPETARQRVPWLVRIADQMVDGLRSLGKLIGRWIAQAWDWLRRVFQGPSTPKGTSALPVAGMHAGVIALIVLASLVAAWLIWRRGWWRRAKPRTAVAVSTGSVQLDREDLTADVLPEESWLELANQSLAGGNFRHALRALYLANLAWLGRHEFLTIHPGKTNLEYHNELRRRTRGVPEVRELFSQNTVVFERAWYGLHEATGLEAAEFRERLTRMKNLLAPPRGVAA